MSDCHFTGCDWTNIYRTCSDGSREYARYVHEEEAHPDIPCERCVTLRTPGGECICRVPTEGDVGLW